MLQTSYFYCKHLSCFTTYKCGTFKIIKGVVLHKFKNSATKIVTWFKRAFHELGYKDILVQFGVTDFNI